MYYYHQGVRIDKTSQGGRMSRASGESEGRSFESGPHGFGQWSSQTNDFEIDACRSLAWDLALLG